MKALRQNLVIGIVVIVGSIFLYWNTYSFPPPLKPNAPGPALFPRFILGIMIVFGALLVLSSIYPKVIKEAAVPVHLDVKKFLFELLLMILYLALLPYLGFIIDSFLYFTMGLVPRMKTRRLKAVIVSALCVACFYLTFETLLNIRLPGLLGE